MDIKNKTVEYHFTSPRLGFRPFTPEDLDSFADLNADEDVMEYFPKRLTTEESEALMNSYNEHIAEYRYGFYAVDLIETGNFIGLIGLKNTTFEADFTPVVEIGWRLHKHYWHKGYATEGAKRCLRFGFNAHQMTEIYSFAPIINEPSIRVMQKIGMTKISEFNHPNVENGHALKTHSLYKLTKSDYLKRFEESIV